MSDPKWLTVTEAAAILRISAKTVTRLVRRGHLRAARVGGLRSLRFRESWLDECLERTTTPIEEVRDGGR